MSNDCNASMPSMKQGVLRGPSVISTRPDDYRQAVRLIPMQRRIDGELHVERFFFFRGLKKGYLNAAGRAAKRKKTISL